MIIEDIEPSNGTEGVNKVLDNIDQQKPYRTIISETDTINLSGKQAELLIKVHQICKMLQIPF